MVAAARVQSVPEVRWAELRCRSQWSVEDAGGDWLPRASGVMDGS